MFNISISVVTHLYLLSTLPLAAIKDSIKNKILFSYLCSLHYTKGGRNDYIHQNTFTCISSGKSSACSVC
jgi:hypothetical protein